MWPSLAPGKSVAAALGQAEHFNRLRERRDLTVANFKPRSLSHFKLFTGQKKKKKINFQRRWQISSLALWSTVRIWRFCHTVRTFSKSHKYKSAQIFITELFVCLDQGQWWYCSDSFLWSTNPFNVFGTLSEHFWNHININKLRVL